MNRSWPTGTKVRSLTELFARKTTTLHTSTDNMKSTGVVLEFEEWIKGRLLEFPEKNELNIRGLLNDKNFIPIKLEDPLDHVYIYFIGFRNNWEVIEPSVVKEQECKHEFIPLFNSISCKHCGVNQ
jgi:hypothetical protein